MPYISALLQGQSPPTWSTNGFMKATQVHLERFVRPETNWVSGPGCMWHQWICIGVYEWSSWRQLTGFLSDISPQYHGDTKADGFWTQIETRPDNRFSSDAKSGWTHSLTWTNTHTCLSSFWAVFQCAIFSAERPQRYLYDSMAGTKQ